MFLWRYIENKWSDCLLEQAFFDNITSEGTVSGAGFIAKGAEIHTTKIVMTHERHSS
mgnify:FL=1